MGARPGGPNNRGHDKVGGPRPSLDQRRLASSGLDARSVKKQAQLFGHGFIGERRIFGLQRNRDSCQLPGVPIRR